MDIKSFLIDGKLPHEPEKKRALEFRLQVAVTVLLSEMAFVDDDFDKSEFELIIKTLVREFKMMDEDAEHLRGISEILIQDKAQIDEAIYTITTCFSKEQCQRVYDMVIAVAEADGVVDRYETFFANYVKERLQI